MITTKLFIGCHVPADLRIQLNQSLTWKQSRVAPDSQMDPIDVTHDKRHYLGYCINAEQISLAQLRELADRLRTAVQRYCNKYPVERVSIYVFPQRFVS